MKEKLPNKLISNNIFLLTRYNIITEILLAVIFIFIMISSGTANGTTYLINSLQDVVAADGVVTLREAIQAANTNVAVYDAAADSAAEMDFIDFDPALTGGTITLNGSSLTITDSLSISGRGAGIITIFDNTLGRAQFINLVHNSMIID